MSAMPKTPSVAFCAAKGKGKGNGVRSVGKTLIAPQIGRACASKSVRPRFENIGKRHAAYKQPTSMKKKRKKPGRRRFPRFARRKSRPS